jgi:bifunctional DNase/RNase
MRDRKTMDKIKLKVLGLSYSISQTGAYALVLSDEADHYRIPIIIGISEAQAIAVQLEHIQTQRPLTHDLIKKLMDSLNVTLTEVYIHHWEAGIYYAELLFKYEHGVVRLDARTSDGVALALRFDAPIYISGEVLEKTAVSVKGDELVVKEGGASLVPGASEMTEENLMRLMEEALKNEDYENASRYRDLLKAKKTKTG